MDFAIDRADLLAAIEKCIVAVPDAKQSTQLFRLMTIDASKRQAGGKHSVRFAAVGQQCSVDTVAPAEIATVGNFNAIPHHLRDVTHSMPEGRVRLSRKGTRVTMKSLTSSRKASFESHPLDMKPIDDPGSSADWVTLDSQELVKVLRAVKAAASWINRDDPDACVLVPRAQKLEVVGCNSYQLMAIETALSNVSERPVVFPMIAGDVLALMAPDDANVRLYSDEHRLYLESADTLVSAGLFAAPILNSHPMMLRLFEDNVTVGPTFPLKLLTDTLKGFSRLGVFAGDKQRDGLYGLAVDLRFGATVQAALALDNADGRDEFDVIRTGAEFGLRVSSRLLDGIITSFGHLGITEVQACYSDNDPTRMLILRSQGVRGGVLTLEDKK